MKKSILLMAMLLALWGCKKNTSTPIATYQEENPLQSYLSSTGFVFDKSYINTPGYFEAGIEFTPLVNGKINAIILELPDINTATRVTIWDAETKKVIRTEIVNVAASNTLTTKTIEALFVEKNRRYAITYNGNDYKNYKKANGTDASYPIVAGNLRIESYGYANTSDQIYMAFFPQNFYGGDLTFKFQQIN